MDITNTLKSKKIKKYALIGAAVVLGLIILLSSVVIVPAGHKGVLLTLGAVSDSVMDEGLNFKIPFVQSVEPVDIRVLKFETDGNNASSKDLQTVVSSIAVNYRVNGACAADLYQSIGMGYEDTVINPSVSEVIKSVTALYTAEELITRRTEVSQQMKEQLQVKLADKYIIIDSFNIVNFQFSDAFNQAIEAKQIAEQEALKAQYELNRVEIEKQQTILKAQGEAEALRLRKQELNDQIIMLEFIEKWDGKMPTYYGGASDGFMFNLGDLSSNAQ